MEFCRFPQYTLIVFAASLAFAQQPSARPATPPSLQAPAGQLGAKPSEGPLVIVSPDTVVITVGNEKVTRAEFEELLRALADTGRPVPPDQKRQMAQQLGELKVVAMEARKRKLDQSEPIKQLIAVQSDSVLAQALGNQITSELKLDDAAYHAYYDAHKAQYETVKASHILIRFKGSSVALRSGEKDLTEDEALAKAQDIRKKLQAGADFAALAKTDSDDTSNADKGGDLGTFGHGRMVAPFDQAAFGLQAGQISEPVKTQFGYHIIKVEAHTVKSFDEAKPDIERRIKPQMAREELEKIKKQIPVTLDLSYFGK